MISVIKKSKKTGNFFLCLHLMFLVLISSLLWKASHYVSLGFSMCNLTNVNYTNIGDQVKFIDTMKFYQQNLEKLAETFTEGEKEKSNFWM